MVYVYPLGDGSHWNDNELRLSVQSLRKYDKEEPTIWVVGERPRCQVDNINLIEFRQNATNNRMIDVCLKLELFMLQNPDITEFVVMSDDIFALRPFDSKEFKCYYWKTVNERLDMDSGDAYWKAFQINAAFDNLNKKCFSTHRPFIVRHRDLFMIVVQRCIELVADPFTRYGNLLQPNEIEEKPNIKINRHTLNWYETQHDWLSIGDRFLLPQNKSKLIELLR